MLKSSLRLGEVPQAFRFLIKYIIPLSGADIQLTIRQLEEEASNPKLRRIEFASSILKMSYFEILCGFYCESFSPWFQFWSVMSSFWCHSICSEMPHQVANLLPLISNSVDEGRTPLDSTCPRMSHIYILSEYIVFVTAGADNCFPASFFHRCSILQCTRILFVLLFSFFHRVNP